MLAGRALFYLDHALSPFAFGGFSDRMKIFCPGPALDRNPPTFISLVAVITGVYYHAQPSRCVFNVILFLFE
jgi:hypothetical protein